MLLETRLGIENPLFLVDGTAFIYRGFYANSSLQRADGFPTNAIYMITRLLLRIIREQKPNRCVFFMDGKGQNFRHELFPLYKANRSASPEELLQQLDPIKRVIQSLGITLHVSQECEADDCIASLAKKFREQMPVIIVGADKDLRQCLHENVWMWDPSGKDEKLLSMADFTQDTGLLPTQWPDVQALIGDTSDNIPGIPGIGPKTAQKIFMDFASLEDIRDGFERMPPKMQQKISAHIEDMFLYRKLTTLSTDFCQDIQNEHLAMQSFDPQELLNILREFELTSLGREVESMLRSKAFSVQLQDFTPSATKNSANAMQGSLFDVNSSTKQMDIPKPSLLKDIQEMPDCTGKTVAIFPANLYQGMRNEQGYVLGMDDKHWHLADISAENIVQCIQNAVRIVCPDVKNLLRTHAAWQSIATTQWFDLGLAAYLLRPEDRDYAWARLAVQWSDFIENTDYSHLLPPTAKALALAQGFEKELAKLGLQSLYTGLEVPLIPVLASMEYLGIAINQEAFRHFLSDVQTQIDALSNDVFAAAGTTFNIRSAQQLGEVLFSTLKLKSSGKTKGGQLSTSQERLEKLSGHPVVDAVLEFRKLEKLRSTYLEPLPRLIDENSRIHSHFNQWATATGRLSSSNPNLQNIPIRGELGKRMRTCFVAQAGHVLISADYSQVELRVLAHMSKDPVLVQAFKNNMDIHTNTAALIFNKNIDDVSADERRNAKTINFGLIYGMGAQKLAQELQISTQEAKIFIENYFKHLGQLKAFYESIELSAKEKGYVTTLTGRRRALPDIHSSNTMKSALARRQAINTVIQGSAADIIKFAMLAVNGDAKLAELNAKLCLQVHDELVIEAPENTAEEAGKRVAELMEGVQLNQENLLVPLLVDWGIGPSWGEAH